MRPRLFPTAALLFLSAWAPIRAHSECAHRIYELPQQHPAFTGVGYRLDAGNLDLVAGSQLKIAHYIEKHRDLPVFSEQVSHEIKADHLDPAKEAILVKHAPDYRTAFAAGLPGSLAELTPQQKELLALAGADLTLAMTGELAVLHSTAASDEARAQNAAQIFEWLQTHRDPKAFTPTSEGHRLIFDERDQAALKQVSDYFAKNPQTRDAILIFGAQHDFTRYPALFPSECVIRPTEFQDSATAAAAAGPAPAPAAK